LICDAAHIPDEISISLKGTDVGDSIHISNVKLPKGVTSAIDDRDFTIATLIAPSALKSETLEQVAEEAAAAEAAHEEHVAEVEAEAAEDAAEGEEAKGE
ncbi:MAG: 50S ribosomal protein L25, partial [Sphingomonas sp.]